MIDLFGLGDAPGPPQPDPPATAQPEEELVVAVQDLVGLLEVAEDLGVPHDRVRRWVERSAATGTPPPLRVLAMGKLYSLAEWRSWYALWRVTRQYNRDG